MNFRNDPIIHQIVDRCHVSTPDHEVIAYAISRLKDGKATFATFTKKAQDSFRKAVLKRHHENGDIFLQVTTGRLR